MVVTQGGDPLPSVASLMGVAHMQYVCAMQALLLCHAHAHSPCNATGFFPSGWLQLTCCLCPLIPPLCPCPSGTAERSSTIPAPHDTSAKPAIGALQMPMSPVPRATKGNQHSFLESTERSTT